MPETTSENLLPDGAHPAGLPAGYRIVPGRPRVAVTNTGKVRVIQGQGHAAEWNFVAIRRQPSGHLTVWVPHFGLHRQHFVHRLVLEAFAGPRPPGHICRHLNGVPDDNRVENLAWGTSKENSADAIEHRRLRDLRKHPLRRHAPETLAALKELLDVAERSFHRWSGGNTASQRRIAAVVIRARRAVAMSEGRDPEKAVYDGK